MHMPSQHPGYSYSVASPEYPYTYASSVRSPHSDEYRPRRPRRSSSAYSTIEREDSAQFSNIHSTPIIPQTNYHTRTQGTRSSSFRYYETRADTPDYSYDPFGSSLPNTYRERSRSPYQSYPQSSPRSRSLPRATPSDLLEHLSDVGDTRTSPWSRPQSPFRSRSRSSAPRPGSRISITLQSRPASASSHHLPNASGRSSPVPVEPGYGTSFRFGQSTISIQIVDDSSTRDSEDSESAIEPMVQPDTITSTMPIEDVIDLLVDHGCPDITQELDLRKCEVIAYSPGGFGDVHRGSLLDGTKVALKCLRSYAAETHGSQRVLKRAARELYAWSRCRHRNVVELFGLVVFQGKLAMVSPWMKFGSINRLSSDSSIDRCRLCTQIARGLRYLHRKSIIHGDLKGANVLLSDDNKAMITDFGSAILERSALTFTETSTAQFSSRWAAPEQLTGQVRCSFEADVYSLGMTILEVISGKLPFPYLSHSAAVIAAVSQGEIPERPEDTIPTASKQGNVLWRLLTNCWHWSPEDRPSVSHVVGTMKAISPQDLIALDPPTNPSILPSATGYARSRSASRGTRYRHRETSGGGNRRKTKEWC